MFQTGCSVPKQGHAKCVRSRWPTSMKWALISMDSDTFELTQVSAFSLRKDLHFAALECNEKTLAQKAQELASNLLVSSSLIGKVLQN
ncbi:hypothetical protein EMCRGX_G020754 [Ephydatia muelleri]